MALNISLDRRAKVCEQLKRVREDLRQAADGLGRASIGMKAARAVQARNAAARRWDGQDPRHRSTAFRT